MIKDFNKTAIITADRDISYSELIRRNALFASESALPAGERMLIVSENREGWLYSLFAVWQRAGIAVPVDATSTVDDIAYIIRDCTPRAAWVSRALADTVAQAAQQAGAKLNILLIDDYERAPLASQAEASATRTQAEACATRMPQQRVPQDNETALIVYTSGTTGSPKGVVLTFANIKANVDGVSSIVPIFTPERRTLILLPLHHILPLMGSIVGPILAGGGVAICPSLAPADIMATLCRGQVAIFIGVPRLWQMLYGGIKKKIDASPVTRFLFWLCSKAHSQRLSAFVFQSVRKKMGGHIDYCVSGGAALDREIGQGLRVLGLDVLEGYGMTETAPIICFTRPDDIVPGSVGRPMTGVVCRLADAKPCEEHGGRLVGELCAKGPNLMRGYWNRPEETAAVIDADGWLHTGDLAYCDEAGRYYIVGRTKEIIVLSNGKNVQPAEIEYKLERFEQQVYEAAVTQDGDMLHAIIVPQDEWIRRFASPEQAEQAMKREVIEPYNAATENYKKLMRLTIYRGELPRTKLDKLQRFKLADIISGKNAGPAARAKQCSDADLSPELRAIITFIDDEKGTHAAPTDHIETDLAFDSLDKVNLEGFIYQNFGVAVPQDSMASYPNIAAMADYIAAHRTTTGEATVELTDWRTVLSEPQTMPLPQAVWTHRWMARAFAAYFKANNRLTVRGQQNLPTDGPCILAPNHQSYFDGALVLAGMRGADVDQYVFYATEEHVASRWRRHMAARHNIIVMSQRNLKASILAMAAALRAGKRLIIFPEGTRTHTGQMGAFKKTFAILARELQVPVVPVRISGAYEAMPRGRVLPTPHHITVEYLTPVVPAGDLSYSDIAERTRQAIQTTE